MTSFDFIAARYARRHRVDIGGGDYGQIITFKGNVFYHDIHNMRDYYIPGTEAEQRKAVFREIRRRRKEYLERVEKNKCEAAVFNKRQREIERVMRKKYGEKWYHDDHVRYTGD